MDGRDIGRQRLGEGPQISGAERAGREGREAGRRLRDEAEVVAADREGDLLGDERDERDLVSGDDGRGAACNRQEVEVEVAPPGQDDGVGLRRLAQTVDFPGPEPGGEGIAQCRVRAGADRLRLRGLSLDPPTLIRR